MPKNRMIVLAGPSCVGKSPLKKTLERLHPGLAGTLRCTVLYNSRSPRPGEKDGEDYHFRRREFIDSLRNDDQYVVVDARGDLQALDIKQLQSSLEKGDVFYEGNPFVGKAILENKSLDGTSRLGIFMSPLSREEIEYLSSPDKNVDIPSLVTRIMTCKLLRRTRRQQGELSASDLRNIETRAESAYDELLLAPGFDFVIPNHDGEDSENWDSFYYPLGDAMKTLDAFVSLLKNEQSPHVEKWNQDLFRRDKIKAT